MWPIRLVAVSVDEIVQHIRDDSYGANLSPQEVVSTFVHSGYNIRKSHITSVKYAF